MLPEVMEAANEAAVDVAIVTNEHEVNGAPSVPRPVSLGELAP